MSDRPPSPKDLQTLIKSKNDTMPWMDFSKQFLSGTLPKYPERFISNFEELVTVGHIMTDDEIHLFRHFLVDRYSNEDDATYIPNTGIYVSDNGKYVATCRENFKPRDGFTHVDGSGAHVCRNGRVFFKITGLQPFWDLTDDNSAMKKYPQKGGYICSDAHMFALQEHKNPNRLRSNDGRPIEIDGTIYYIYRVETDIEMVAYSTFLTDTLYKATALRLVSGKEMTFHFYMDSLPKFYDLYEKPERAKPSSGGAKPSSGGAKPSLGGAKPSSGDSDTTHIAKGLSTSFVLKGRINDPSKNNDLVSSFLREDGTYLINTTSIPKGWKEGVKTPISVMTHTGIKIPICNVTHYDSTVPLKRGDVLIHVKLSI